MTRLSHPGSPNGFKRCTPLLGELTVAASAIPEWPTRASDNPFISSPGSMQQCFQFVDNRSQLCLGQLGIHRQGEELFGTPFGDRKRPFHLSQKSIRLL